MIKKFNKKRLLKDMKDIVNYINICNDDNYKRELFYYLFSSLSVISREEDMNKYLKLLNINKTEYLEFINNTCEDMYNIYFYLFENSLSFKYIFEEIFNNNNYNKIFNREFELKEDFYFTQDSFIELFKLFCKDIGKEKEFNNIYKNKNIINISNDFETDFLGRFFYNPKTLKKDIYIKDLDYSLDDLFTLIHEFGHYNDLSNLIDNRKYNELSNYLYSLKIEVNSLLYEKLFIDFMIRNKYFDKEIKDKALFINYEEINFLYNSYLLLEEFDNLDNEFNVVNKTQEDIFFGNGLTLIPNITYGVGEYISTILYDNYKKNGFNSDVFEDYNFNKTDIINVSDLYNEDFNPSKYNKIKVKELKRFIK